MADETTTEAGEELQDTPDNEVEKNLEEVAEKAEGVAAAANSAAAGVGHSP